ncbi:MAG: toll/interleukin-1 receptor domain-containing protein [Clostridia bacterium]|nr:toll/interleukin-1 receptor domain-containing protein [Clostridia bacterium]
MRDIFVSYTNVDKKTAYQIVDFLEANGVSCFIAPRNIDAGKAYAANLMQAINDCKAVLLIASEAINRSEHVLNEVDVIIEKKKALLPVFIEDFELNDDY